MGYWADSVNFFGLSWSHYRATKVCSFCILWVVDEMNGKTGLKINTAALLALLAGVMLITNSVVIGVLYRISLDAERAHLVEKVKSQANLIEILLTKEVISGEKNAQSIIGSRSYQLIRDSYKSVRSFGETGELVFGYRGDDMIRFLWSHRRFDLQSPRPVPWESDLAEPMRRALLGQRGVMDGAEDYAGARVMAAYEPLSPLGLGLVAKIDIAEIRQPFITAAAITILSSMLLLAIASLFLLQKTRLKTISQPSAGRLTRRDPWFEATMDNIADGIIMIDEQGKVLAYNAAAKQIFGYDPSEIVGRNLSLLMSAKEGRLHDSYIQRYLMSGVGQILGRGPRELTALRNDGSEVPIELTIDVFESENSKIFIGSVRDISERKLQQIQLIQAQKMEAVGQLTGGLAHDFNNLLTAIQGNLELLRDKVEKGSSGERFINTAEKASKRGAELVNNLMAFSRRQSVSNEIVQSNSVVEDAIRLVGPSLQESIKLEVFLAEDTWEVNLDAAQLENALVNIIFNAKDAIKDSGTIKVTTNNTYLDQNDCHRLGGGRPGPYVRIAIVDNGSGMSQEVIDRVFEPFFSTKESGMGTGLGLSMVYGFIKQSKGLVRLQSEENGGSSFELFFPKSKLKKPETPNLSKEQTSLSTGYETILVVEDNDDVRAFVATSLQMLGYTVLEAADAKAAGDLMDSGPVPNLVLSDVILQGDTTGPQLAEELLKKYSGLRLMFMSGHARQAFDEATTQVKNALLLRKPFSREKLASSVRSVLDQDIDSASSHEA